MGSATSKIGRDILPDVQQGAQATSSLPNHYENPPRDWDPYSILSERPPKKHILPWRRKKSIEPAQLSTFALPPCPQPRRFPLSGRDSECSTPVSSVFSPITRASTWTTPDETPTPNHPRKTSWDWTVPSAGPKTSVSSPNVGSHNHRIPRRPLRRSSLQFETFNSETSEPPCRFPPVVTHHYEPASEPAFNGKESRIYELEESESEGVSGYSTEVTNPVLSGVAEERSQGVPDTGSHRPIDNTLGGRGPQLPSSSSSATDIHNISAGEPVPVDDVADSDIADANRNPPGQFSRRQEILDRTLAARLQQEEFFAADIDINLADIYALQSDPDTPSSIDSSITPSGQQLSVPKSPFKDVHRPNRDSFDRQLAELLHQRELAAAQGFDDADYDQVVRTPSSNRRKNRETNPFRKPQHDANNKRNTSAEIFGNDAGPSQSKGVGQKSQNSSSGAARIREDADRQLAQQLQDEELKLLSPAKTRDCVVCSEEIPIPDFPALMDCEHEPQTCASCYNRWIESELNTKAWSDIKCPEHRCKVLLQHFDVQRYATLEVYTKFDALSARSALNDCENFRWCLGPGCKSGQEHLDGIDGNIFRCNDCGFRACVIHNIKWHEGETCQEYDYRVSGRQAEDQRKAEIASAQTIKELTKQCPGKGCTWNIEKNDGCDHMTCLKCKHEFCWVCLAPYDPIRRMGNSRHRTSCRYHSNKLN